MRIPIINNIENEIGDDSLLRRLLKTVNSPKDILDVLFNLLFGCLQSGSFDFSPLSDFSAARLAKGDAGICRIVRKDNCLAPALLARERDVDFVHESLSFDVSYSHNEQRSESQ